MISYIMIPENEYILRKGEVKLNATEAEILMEHEDTFKKFLAKAKMSYKIELSKGTFRGNEEKLHRAIEVVEELSDSLESIRTAYKDYIAKLDKPG